MRTWTIVLLILAIVRALSKDAPETPDTPMLLLYIFLTAVLSFLSLIPVAVSRGEPLLACHAPPSAWRRSAPM